MAAGASFGGFGVSFTLFDGFSGVADSIRGKFSQLQNDTNNMAAKINEGLSGIAAGAAQVAIGIGLLSPVILGVKFAGQFEAAEIALKTFLGTTEAAHAAFENIKRDAAITPFQTQDLLDANLALISTGKSAEESRDVVLALGNALSAAGKGSAEMSRMAINLQQIANNGKAMSMDIKQFGYAGINIYQLLADATGKAKDSFKGMDISYDLLAMALKKSAQAGGIFEGAMERMSRSINGKISTIMDNVKFSLAAIGEAVLPIVHPLMDFVIEMTTRFQTFAQTGVGKLIIKIGVVTLSIIALTLVVSGLKMIFLSLGPIIAGAFAPLLPFIAVGAAIFGILNHLAGGFDNLKLVFKGLIQVFRSAGHEGFSMSEDIAAALDKVGLLDFVVSMGTWFVRIKEFFSGFIDGMKQVFDVISTAAIGIWNIVITAIDAIIEVLNFFGINISRNTADMEKWVVAGKLIAYVIGTIMVIAVIAITMALWDMAAAVVAALWPVILIIGVLVGVFYVVYEVVTLVWAGLKMLGDYIWDNFGPALTFMWNILKFIGQFFIWMATVPFRLWLKMWELIGQMFMWVYDKAIKPAMDGILSFVSMIGSVVETVIDKIGNIFSFFWTMISGFVSTMFDMGKGLVMAIWDGVKAVWSSFTDWLSKAWNASPLGMLTNFFIDGAVSLFNDVGTGKEDFNSISAKVSGTEQGLNSIGRQNGERIAGMDPIVTHNTTEKVSAITVVNQVDSEEVGRKVFEKREFDQARE